MPIRFLRSLVQIGVQIYFVVRRVKFDRWLNSSSPLVEIHDPKDMHLQSQSLPLL